MALFITQPEGDAVNTTVLQTLQIANQHVLEILERGLHIADFFA